MKSNIKEKYLNLKDEIKKEALIVQDYIFKYKDLFDVDIAFRENINDMLEIFSLKYREQWSEWKAPWVLKQKKWKELYKEIYDCEACQLDFLRRNRKKNKISGVFVENVIPKPIMVIQELTDPISENSNWNMYNMQFGCPLTFGQSAKIFEDMANYIGVTKNQLYLTTLVKCGCKAKEHTNQEVGGFIRECKPHLEKQIKLHKPVIIWTIGVSVFEYMKLYLEDNYMNVKKEVLYSFENRVKHVYHTENFILVNSSNPYYIMQKEKEYWFLKKEMAMLDLLKILIINLEKKGIL